MDKGINPSLRKAYQSIITQSPWTVAASNLLLLMVLYTLARVFFYCVSRDLFPSVTLPHLLEMLLGGMRFDLTAILYLSSLYLLLMLLPLPWKWRTNHTYQQVAKWCLWVPNILGIIVNSADMVYMRFTNRRTTMTFFSEFQHDDNLLRIFLTGMVQYWYVTLFAVLSIVLLVLLTRQNRESDEPLTRHPLLYYPFQTGLLCLSVYFIIIGIRGGFGAYTRPITLSNALQYTNRPEETMLVLNTPFALMRSTEGRTYHDPQYFDRDTLEQLMTPCHDPELLTPYPMDRLNVVVLILESFSKEYIGYYNRHLDGGTYTGYTPFLDSLLEHSISYRLSFASGRKSIDAMPSVLSSIPMLIEPYVVTAYSTNRVSSLADCLGREGYHTAFYHGAPNGSMGFQAYARSAGFEAYCGMDEYRDYCRRNGRDADDDYDGTWAIWDDEFLQYMAYSLDSLPEPFLASVFTASSHHPFRVPERYEGAFPAGTQPIHACIGYTDMALRHFFDYARRQAWYSNTLFVLTADHTNLLTHPEYQTAKGLYEVPIIFFHEAWQQGLLDTTNVLSQTDIMPSVLAYLGYDKPFFAFGENGLTRAKEHAYAICYNAPLYQIFSDSLLLQFDGQEPRALYNYRRDPLLRHPLPPDQAPPAMLTYLKAYIQQYIVRMRENHLTY